MTDDIVTRLRSKYLGQLPILFEAADEIERLRKELALQGCDCDACIYGSRND